MNRDHRYRVWDISHQCFLPEDTYGLITTDFGAFGIMIKDWENYKEGEYLYPNAQIQSDWTGLKDNDSNSIFEGDVDEDYNVVTWCDKRNGWSLSVYDFPTKEFVFCHCYRCEGNFEINELPIKIIGNIYQHHHLLNQ